MRARLFCKTGRFAGTGCEIEEEARIGRSPDNDLVVPSEIVSSRHARVFWDPDEEAFLIEDLGSRNGIFVDGVRIREPERLDRLDVIRLADRFDFVFQLLPDGWLGEKAMEASVETAVDADGWLPPPDLAGETDASPAAERQAEADEEGRTVVESGALAVPELPLAEEGGEADEPDGAGPRIHLRLELESGAVETVALESGRHVIGRALECEISLEDPSLSRRHASLEVGPDGARLRDLGSTNETRVNGRPIDGEVPIEPGMLLELGSVRARLVEGPLSSPPGTDFPEGEP